MVMNIYFIFDIFFSFGSLDSLFINIVFEIVYVLFFAYFLIYFQYYNSLTFYFKNMINMNIFNINHFDI